MIFSEDSDLIANLYNGFISDLFMKLSRGASIACRDVQPVRLMINRKIMILDNMPGCVITVL